MCKVVFCYSASYKTKFPLTKSPERGQTLLCISLLDILRQRRTRAGGQDRPWLWGVLYWGRRSEGNDLSPLCPCVYRIINNSYRLHIPSHSSPLHYSVLEANIEDLIALLKYIPVSKTKQGMEGQKRERVSGKRFLPLSLSCHILWKGCRRNSPNRLAFCLHTWFLWQEKKPELLCIVYHYIVIRGMTVRKTRTASNPRHFRAFIRDFND